MISTLHVSDLLALKTLVVWSQKFRDGFNGFKVFSGFKLLTNIQGIFSGLKVTEN